MKVKNFMMPFDFKYDVSVVIAAKNEELYLAEALESILSQEHVSLEIIFVDDNSTDQTYEIARTYAQNHGNLKVIKNDSKGKCSAFNLGVTLAVGRFVCLFAGDDIMPPNSLSLRFKAVNNESDNLPVVGLCKILTMSENRRLDGHLIPRAKNRGALSGMSPLMNGKALSLIFPVPEFLPNEDTWMELAILHLSDIKVLHNAVIGCYWRCHSGNSINTMLSYSEYNAKITERMNALFLFYSKFEHHLLFEQKKLLLVKIRLEEFRRSSGWMRIIFLNVALTDKLRALSVSNEFIFYFRKKFYGIFSGW